MNDAERHPPEDQSGLERENQALRTQILGLHKFIDSMQNLVDAVEQPLTEVEIMELLADVLGNALQTINAKDGSLLVLEEETRELVFVLAQGDVPRADLAWHRLPAGEGIAGWVAEHRTATIVNDAQLDDRFYSAVDREFDFRTRSILAAPIIGGGRVLGVIELLNKRDKQLFKTSDQTLLTLLCRFSGELLHTVVRQSDAMCSPVT